MKAVVFKEIGQPMAVEDVADLRPGSGEVILKVHRCGICGSDLHMTEPGGITAACNSVLGHEISGEVIELGNGATGLKVGDRVAALPLKGCGQCDACKAGEPSWCAQGLNFLGGGYAQFARAGAAECLLLSQELSFSDGALVEPLAVALHGIRMAGDLRGKVVTVIGCGPIGLAAVFWASRLGAAKVQVVEGNSFRGDMASTMGANSLFMPSAQRPEGTSAPELADVVVECVGKPGLLQASLGDVRNRGTVISLGFCMAPEQFVAAAAGTREVTIKFPVLYTMADYRDCLAALERGDVEPRAMVTKTVGLSSMPMEFEALRKPSRDCKVMFDPWLS